MSYAERECLTCSRTFKPSSRHFDCPACRGRAMRSPCPKCGELKARTSTVCEKCCPSFAGHLNPNWKGGSRRHQKGYIQISSTDPDRPKYVFEHVLVMESVVGRRLVSGENVHHINGVRDDNRPENLELWIKPQPTGIRIPDAVAWARQIIELYDTP